MVLALITFAAFCCATGTFDDVQGYRDGTDLANYGPQTELRSLWRKPLLVGDITEAEAVRFGWAAVAFGLTMAVVTWWAAGMRPSWFLPAYLGVACIAVQYSYGLKLSYVGGQELVIFSGFAGAVVFPYVLANGRVTATVLVVASICALWVLQVLVFSNSNDVEGDRASNRRTMAVRTTARGNHRYIVALFVLDWTVVVASVTSGWLEPWYLVGLAPLLIIHALQLYHGVVRCRYLYARMLGWISIRLGALALIGLGIGVHWT
jgi:1,4-dihydroxy-2-naphthoate octaprenyltransferase